MFGGGALSFLPSHLNLCESILNNSFESFQVIKPIVVSDSQTIMFLSDDCFIKICMDLCALVRSKQIDA